MSCSEDPEASGTPSKRPKHHHDPLDIFDTCHYASDWNSSVKNTFYDPLPSFASEDDDSNEFGQHTLVSSEYSSLSVFHVEQTLQQITQNSTEQGCWDAMPSENLSDVIMCDAASADEVARHTSQSALKFPGQEDICFGMV
jgi:hypothetical protein